MKISKPYLRFSLIHICPQQKLQSMKIEIVNITGTGLRVDSNTMDFKMVLIKFIGVLLG